MDLFYAIVAQTFSEDFEQMLSALHTELLHDRCYQALEDIRAVLDDDRLDDVACFEKIERIVEIYESLGSRTTRHDFG